MAVEKRITSPLMEPSSIEKILEVDSHISEREHFSLSMTSVCACVLFER